MGFERLVEGDFDLYLTNEVLTEYEEQVIKRFGLGFTDSRLDFLLLLPNVHQIVPFYRWQLIHQDPDDNKFVDCAVAANADFIVTHDRHFRVLDKTEFPRMRAIDLNTFYKMLDG